MLLLNHFFPPDPAPTGQLLAALARHLAAEGHDLTVICAAASYAEPDPSEPPPPVRILRTPSLPFARTGPARLLSYASFYLGALWWGLRTPKPGLVLTLTTPPLLSLLGTLLKKLRGARHVIWEMDLYPDVAIDLGLLRPRSLLTRALAALADYSRRHADAIIVLGPCMKERLLTHPIPASKIHVAENWADGALISPLPTTHNPQSTIHNPQSTIHTLRILYSGNLGLAHDLDTISAAMLALKDDPRFRFIFAGAGPRRKPLEDFCRDRALHNVAFLPYQPRHRLSDHLAACHLGLVTQHPNTLGSVVPSKIYALMAAARPVLFIGPRAATPARIIQRFRCGWQIDPGDANSLISLLHLLASDPALLRDAGHRARQAFLEHYDLPIGVNRITAILSAIHNLHPIRLCASASPR